MPEQKSSKAWPGEPPGLWPAPEPAVRDERRTDAERIDVLREGFRIEHAVSRRVGPALVSFVDRPWEEHQRWRGLLLVGPARSGRSWLVSRWLPKNKYTRRASVIPARLPVDVTNDGILRAILDGLSDHGPSGTTKNYLRAEVSQVLKDARALVFDDCDHLANLSKAQLWRALARVKSIAEGDRVPVVLVVNPVILQAISENPDWDSRFEVLHLPKWRVDADFLSLLTEWEDRLPLQEASRLADREMALHLYSLCDGCIGRLGKVLHEASLAAIGNARERITIGLLDSLGMSPPASFRKFLF